MSSGIRFTTILQRLLTVAVLLTAFFLSAGAVIYFAYGGRTVQVPDLIGKVPAEAEGQLESLGLRMKVINTAPSEKVDKDRISDQEPRVGVTVKTGQSIRIVVSSGLVPAASPTPKPTLKPTPKPTLKPAVSPSPAVRKAEERRADSKANSGNKAANQTDNPASKKSDAGANKNKTGQPGSKDARPRN